MVDNWMQFIAALMMYGCYHLIRSVIPAFKETTMGSHCPE